MSTGKKKGISRPTGSLAFSKGKERKKDIEGE